MLLPDFSLWPAQKRLFKNNCPRSFSEPVSLVCHLQRTEIFHAWLKVVPRESMEDLVFSWLGYILTRDCGPKEELTALHVRGVPFRSVLD